MIGRLLLVVTAIALLAGGGWFLYQRSASSASQEAAQLAAQATAGQRDPEYVTALGRLEPAGGVINVAGTAGDRVAALHVAEAQHVQAGATLATLQSNALRTAERQYAQTQLEEAIERRTVEQAYGDSLVLEAEVGIEQLALLENDVAAQQAQVAVLQHNLKAAQQDLQRLTSLGDDITSPQQMEQATLRVEQAEAELEAAGKSLKKLKASIPLQRRQAEAKLEAAKATRQRALQMVPVESARRNVEMADESVKLTVVQAPTAGRILNIYTHPGEAIGSQPVLTMADVENMVAVAEVYETDVRFVRPGQKATISSSALAEDLTGVVERVGSQVGQNQMVSLDPTRSADLRIVEVRIRLDEPSAAADMINLQVTVTIDTSSRGGPDGQTARAANGPTASR